MEYTANLAIQVLPLEKSTEEAYAIIDTAIACIQNSGLEYIVCPFETIVEGKYEALISLLKNVQDACFTAGCDGLLINMKLHRNSKKSLFIEDKTGKYTKA